METRRKKRMERIDYGIILPVFLLILIGTLAIYVALSHDIRPLNIKTEMFRQGFFIILGILSIVVLIHFSNRIWWRLSPIAYVTGLILMVLPIFLYSPTLLAQTGSKNWIVIGNTPLFQPSELMKIAYILLLAYLVTQHNSYYTKRRIKTDLLLLAKLILTTLPVAVLLYFQSDFGSLLVFFAILGGVLLLSGISWFILGPIILAIAAIASSTIYLVTNDTGRMILSKIGVKAYQFARIDSWLHPFQDVTNNGYQQANGLIAIGSGGIHGKGFNVSQVYVPVRESDMIFTVIGENFGFIGGIFIILLYFILIYRMIRVTQETNNQFYTYIATGIIMMILFHVFENIGSNIGLLPLTGIPLPFISAGGTSLIGNMIGIGLILSMKFHQRPDFDEWKKGRLTPVDKIQRQQQHPRRQPTRGK